jgi:hypothetical protein
VIPGINPEQRTFKAQRAAIDKAYGRLVEQVKRDDYWALVEQLLQEATAYDCRHRPPHHDHPPGAANVRVPPMIHFATVHHVEDHWVDLQLRQLSRHVSGPYAVYACLNGPRVTRHADRFHFAHRRKGWRDHGEKLNFLAEQIATEAAPDDVIAFIDGDAFPIAPIDGALDDLLAEAPLVAIRRDENEDTYPHPSFCATRVGFWKELGGDWRDDRASGGMDVGGRVAGRLEELGVAWKPLLRVNARNLHPVLFGVYGDARHGPLVYHHGAGFRGGHPVTRADLRWAWERGTPRDGQAPLKDDPVLARRALENAELAQYVYGRITATDDFAAELFL